MTQQEAWKLRRGDRVVIWRGTNNEAHGTVANRAHDTSWIRFDWDDGENTGIHPADMEAVERETAHESQP